MSLQRGQKFELGGLTFRVAYVNASRAHCVAKKKTTVMIRGRAFIAKRPVTIDISPNAAVELLSQLETLR